MSDFFSSFSVTQRILAAISATLALVALFSTTVLSVLAPTSILYGVLEETFTFPMRAFIVLIISSTIAQYGYLTVGHELTFSVIRHLRLSLYKHIIFMPLDIWQMWRQGDILERLIRNLEALDGLLLRVIIPATTLSCVTGGWLIWIALFVSGWLALMAASIVLGFMIYLAITIKTRIQISEQFESGAAELRVAAVEISAARHQIYLAGTGEAANRMLESAANPQRKARAQQTQQKKHDTLAKTLLTIANLTLVIAWWLIADVSRNWQTIACVLSALPISALVAQYISVLQTLTKSLVAWRRVVALTLVSDYRHTVATNATATTKHHKAPTISCQKLCFGYRSQLVVRNVTAHFAAATTTVISGQSGAGKSTLLHLIAGHYKPQQGQILLNGEALDSIAVASRHHYITLIAQDYSLFFCSVANNMRLACATASADQMRAALTAVHLDNWYAKLPNGLETVVGQGAQLLSGGQLRRFAVACALLRDTPIWLLDEPIVHLDDDSAQHVATIINQLIKNKTAIIVTHRHAKLFAADTRLQYTNNGLY